MPSNAAGRRAVLSVHNSDGRITLLELSHPARATKRLAMAKSNVSHGGQTFIAFPFMVEYPTDEKGIPTGHVRISNVTREVLDFLKGLDSPPQVSLFWVLESDTETKQDEWALFDVHQVTGTMLTVEAEISQEDYATEPYASKRLTGDWAHWMNFY